MFNVVSVLSVWSCVLCSMLFLFCLSGLVSYVLNRDSASELSIHDCPFVDLDVNLRSEQTSLDGIQHSY